MTIKMFDTNNYSFDSNETVGFSIVTLAEITKGKNEHGRHSIYKKFLNCYFNKANYHIYLPHELDALKYELENLENRNDIQYLYQLLDIMCCKILTLIYSFFAQIICVIVLLIVLTNHNLRIIDKQIPYFTEQEKKVAEFANAIVFEYADIDRNKEKLFGKKFFSWKKGDGDEYGNNLFNKLIKRYLDLIGDKDERSYTLCGQRKNIKDLLKNGSVEAKRVHEVFDAYFRFGINDYLIKQLYIPYLCDAVNNTETRFEFNHISDSFLIFNSLTAKSNEKAEVVIDSNDELLKRIYKSILSNCKHKN